MHLDAAAPTHKSLQQNCSYDQRKMSFHPHCSSEWGILLWPNQHLTGHTFPKKTNILPSYPNTFPAWKPFLISHIPWHHPIQQKRPCPLWPAQHMLRQSSTQRKSDLCIFHVGKDHTSRIWKYSSNTVLDRPKTSDRWLNIASGLPTQNSAQDFSFFSSSKAIVLFLQVRRAILK